MTPQGLASKAEFVLDPRLVEVWQLIWSGDADPADGPTGTVPEAMLAALLRLAYLQGYADATAEPDPGGLYRELGVRGPGFTGGRRAPGARRRPRSSGR